MLKDKEYYFINFTKLFCGDSLDKSNYEYQYKRIGGLSKIQFKKYRKMVIELKDDKNLPKVLELLNKLKIKAEVAII